MRSIRSILVAGAILFYLTVITGFRQNGRKVDGGRARFRRAPTLQYSTKRPAVVASSGTVASSTGALPSSFVDQKNYIVFDRLERAAKGESAEGDLTEVVTNLINFCDESFNVFLNDRIANAPDEEKRELLGRVRYEINSARQKRLIEADKTLRGILSAGGLKQMEAKLYYHMRRAEIDMAFMVILQLNIEDAISNKVEKAVQIMTHLETLILEHQDKMVSAPVRLMRLLLRTDDSMVRKQMLRQKLVEVSGVTNSTMVAAAAVLEKDSPGAGTAVIAVAEDGAEIAAQPTSVPQCEHIVVSAVQGWGGADVPASLLMETITDVLNQMTGCGGEQDTISEMQAKCKVLELELKEVLTELTIPKVSDMCEDDKAAAVVR